MKLVENILTSSPCYKAGRTITPKGLMIHSVGTPQPKASVFVNIFASSTAACVHAVMGPDGVVYQILPWNRRAWHAGSPANDMFISIECTEPSSISYTSGANFKDNNPTATKAHVDAVYKHAVEFAAYICKKYGFDPTNSNQLLSHNEGYKKGYATNHSDVEHLWGKYGYTMNQFRKDVKASMTGGSSSGGSGSSGGGNSSGGSSSGAAAGEYTVKVTADELNIRSGAGTNYKVVSSIKDKGTYTIVQTSGDWGKLKSGAGWINLGYTTKGTTASTKAYTVRITADELNVRKGAGTSYAVVTVVKKGEVYTIVEESNGWGKLKSGAGWIHLGYTAKV